MLVLWQNNIITVICSNFLSIHVGFSKVTLDFAEFVLVLNSCFWHDLYSELISASPCLELSWVTLAGKVDIAVIITPMSAWASALLLDVCQNFQWAFLFCILWFNLPNSITPWDLCSHLISYKKKKKPLPRVIIPHFKTIIMAPDSKLEF